MLQPLGISAEAEAVYVVLARTENASVGELARASNGHDVVRLRGLLESLRELGLATDTGGGRWQALPLMDVVHSLRSQRLSELDSASVAAESLQNRLLASTQTKQQDNITVLVGREAIIAARDELCNAAKREICNFDKPPYVQARPNATPESLHEDAPGVAGARARGERTRRLPPGLRRRPVVRAGPVRCPRRDSREQHRCR